MGCGSCSASTGKGSGLSGGGGGSERGQGDRDGDGIHDEQLRRLDEERRRLDEEVNAFHEHMANLRKARDREEFDRFMRDRNASRQGYEGPGPTYDNEAH